jgi:Domain of unknown function (DUF4440)
MKKNVASFMESAHLAKIKTMSANRRIIVILALCASFAATIWAADAASEAEVRKAQDSFAHCWATRDADCMASLLAPDFSWVFRTGIEVDRDAFLATIMDGRSISPAFAGGDDAVIHFYGPVALLTFPTNDGTNAPQTILTLVWFNSNGDGWQLVRGQGTWKAPTR